MILAAAHGPSVLWYVSRGAGAVTLVLLTVSVVFGVGEARSWRPAGLSRYTVATVHRTVSLLALALLTLHVTTTLLDPFPHIAVLAAFVPFVSGYRPLWLGLGALASDLLLAVAVTSVVRRRLGYRAWRAVHWAAYGCWPVAVAHGLGTGSDAARTWMLALTLGCVAAVVAVIAARLVASDVPRALRVAGGGVVLACVGTLAIWLPSGPLAPGWARKAGTPEAVLAAFRPARAQPAVHRTAAADPLGRRFSAGLSGRLRSGTGADGSAVVDLSLRLDHPNGLLRVRLGGQAAEDGGLQMEHSAVTLGPPGDPGRYQGRVQVLEGTTLQALVGSPDGRAVRLTVDLSIGQDSVTGLVHGVPVGGGH